MEYAVTQLEPVHGVAVKRARIFFMTGRRHWFETAFCAYSFTVNSDTELTPIVYDDGTLEAEQAERLRVLFPSLKLIEKAKADEYIGHFLPPTRFPLIHRWRQIQPLTRKLFDVHCGSAAWNLFLDSDMLFFRTPVEVLKYLQNPQMPIVQTDCWESYGYSRRLTERLTGKPLPEAVNIGIFALNGAYIDWEEIEYWLNILEREEKRKYNMTQCLCAMLMSRGNFVRLDRERYKVWPGKSEARCPTAVMHHYVAESKPSYYRWGWRNALACT